MAKMDSVMRIHADDFFKDTRMNDCDNHACRHNSGIGLGKCAFKEITLNFQGVCDRMEEKE